MVRFRWESLFKTHPLMSIPFVFTMVVGPTFLFTIGLTIPAVAVTSIALGLPLTLGLPPKEVTLLALTLLLTAMTLTGGRATVLQGAVHLVVFAVFLFLAMVP